VHPGRNILWPDEEELYVTIITLFTDFGLKDGNVGVMKGVIWGIASTAQIADISHNISPQNIREAALILFRSAPYFPAGTIHTVVVDPGVGTKRRPIAAQLGNHFFVGPDNGVFTMLLERVEKLGETKHIICLDKPRYWLPEVSNVFHGRDIFAPVAGHLAIGVGVDALGTKIGDPIRLTLPQPERTENGWQGEIIHIDHFGNISSNILIEHLGSDPQVSIEVGETRLDGMVHTFGEEKVGELVALYGSTGNLIVSAVNGNAAERLGVVPGDPVEVIIKT